MNIQIITDDVQKENRSIKHIFESNYVNDMAKTNDTVFFRKPDYIIEHPLYRYRSNIDHAVDEIQSGHIYLASPKQQNDPFDSSYAQTDIDLKQTYLSVDQMMQVISSVLPMKKEAIEKYWESRRNRNLR